MKYKGLLLKESLKDEIILETLKITKEGAWNVDNAADFQPNTWHPVWFEGDGSQADEVAENLSQALHPNWYCTLVTDLYSYVIFGGAVFKYPRGDKQGRLEAQAHGRSSPIPFSPTPLSKPAGHYALRPSSPGSP